MHSLKDCFTLRNGVKIPCVGFGTWQTPDGEVATNSVREAIACGYRHIDTAAVYGNEEGVGLGIRQSGIAREELFVTTKVWNSDHGYDSTLKAFDLSMKKLGLEYCDLYLIHWPNPIQFRDCWEEKNAQTWKAMEKLYFEGRVRAIGISNFQPHHILSLLKSATILPMVNQMCLHPAQNQTEMVEYCKKLGIVLEAYSPLGTGALLKQPEILACAEKYGKSPAQILLRWSLQKGFLPLPKSVTAQRIRENTDIFSFELEGEDVARLSALEGRIPPSWNADTADF